MRNIAGILLLGFILAFIGCGQKNTPPAYIKECDMQKFGDDAVKVAFVLVDKNDKQTAASGTVTFEFSRLYIDMFQRNHDDVFQYRPLHTLTYKVTPENFTVNDNKILAYRTQRILYSSFNIPPKIGTQGRVNITFVTDQGETFTAKSMDITWKYIAANFWLLFLYSINA